MSETDIRCPECDGTIMGVEVPGVYDGALFWQCMACGHPFHRFEVGDPLRIKAQTWVTQIKEERARG